MAEPGDVLNIDGRIACSDELPVAVRALDAWPGEARLERINTSNEVLLRALVAMDALPVAHGEEHERHSEDIQRLEARVGLLLNLVARLVEAQQTLPDPLPVVYNARGMQVQLATPAGVGGEVAVDLYLSGLYPTPLQLFGVVAACDRKGDTWHVSLMLRGMTQAMRSELEKLVFRRHRRQVARQRERH